MAERDGDGSRDQRRFRAAPGVRAQRQLPTPDGEPVQVSFDAAFDAPISNADPVEVAGVAVPVVTRGDLIAMKERAADDPARRRSEALRDRADIEVLRGDVPDEDEGW